jgi:hypothetical protein
VFFIIGGWVATFVLAETACWVGLGAPGGAVAWERIPPTNTLTLDVGDVAATCNSGAISPVGGAVAGALLGLAITAAACP